MIFKQINNQPLHTKHFSPNIKPGAVVLSFYLLFVHFLMDYLHPGMSKDVVISVRCVCRHSTDHLLDEGVVGGVHAGAQRIETLSITVIS